MLEATLACGYELILQVEAKLSLQRWGGGAGVSKKLLFPLIRKP